MCTLFSPLLSLKLTEMKQWNPGKPISEARKEVVWGTLARKRTAEMPEDQKSNVVVNPLQIHLIPQNLCFRSVQVFSCETYML